LAGQFNINEKFNELVAKETLPEQVIAFIKKVKKENEKLQFINERLKNDKTITERFLNTSIKDLEIANEEIKAYKEKEIAEKEQTIRLQESHLQQIIDAVPSIMAFVDKDFRYQLVNKSYDDWFGKKPEAIKGKHIKEVLGEAFFNHRKKDLVKAFNGQTVTFDFEAKTIKGEDLKLKANYIPALDPINKNVIGVYVYVQNVTEQKNNEAAIAAKNAELEKYIETNMQLENFAYLASHDLRSPLNNILNFSNLLAKTADNKLDEREKKYLHFIGQSSERMRHFIEDLLAYSVASNKQIEFSSINPRQLINDVLTDISHSIEKNNATVNINNLPDIINGDKVLLKQLFLNLITNALKFVKPNIAPIINISCSQNKTHFTFNIADNGIGIAEESQKRIFGIFKRLHLSSEYEGTGIGLSTCKNAVEKHGGKIWVESIENKGSTFKFTIKKPT